MVAMGRKDCVKVAPVQRMDAEATVSVYGELSTPRESPLEMHMLGVRFAQLRHNVDTHGQTSESRARHCQQRKNSIDDAAMRCLAVCRQYTAAAAGRLIQSSLEIRTLSRKLQRFNPHLVPVAAGPNNDLYVWNLASMTWLTHSGHALSRVSTPPTRERLRA